MTIAGATYREGIAYSADGAMYVTGAAGGSFANPTFTGNQVGNTYPIAQSFVAVTAPADTNENTLATISVPANAMGANGRVRVHAEFTITSSANVKTVRLKFGGTSFVAQNMTTTPNFILEGTIANRGATNSQVGISTVIQTANTFNSSVTAAIDTTAAVTILITGQKATAGEAFVLEGYTVEVIRP